MLRFVRFPTILPVLAVVVSLSLRAGEAAPPPPAQPAKPAKPAKPAEEKKDAAPAEKKQPTVVVTAERLATPVEQTGVSMTVVDGRENEEVFQNITLGESLRPVPGVRVAESGLSRGFTSVFIRGGNSNHTLFLFDGWKINRQGGNFDVSHTDPVQLDRIEIARGPASALFGTDAVTGAVNVLTAKGEGRPELKVSAAGGTFGTDRETLSMQGQEKKFSYNVTAARLHRDHAQWKNTDLEAYNYAARFDFEINKDHRLKAVIRGSDDHEGFYDDSGTGFGPAVEPADPNDESHSRDILAGIEYKGRVMPIWETTLRLGHYFVSLDTFSREPNPTSPVGGFAQTAGKTRARERRPSADWQNDITAWESADGNVRDIISVGANIEQESFKQDDTIFFANTDSQRTNWSVFVQNRLELYRRAFITLGGRREQHGLFGGFTTGRADVAILVPESDTRIHGSVGNAFRAPSFFEFFSAFGNPDLTPEKNFAYDVGVEQHFWKKRITAGATWFHNDFKDLVSFSFDTSRMENMNKAMTRGFEFSLEARPINKIVIRGAATLMNTEDNQGRHLLRRPGSTYTAQVIAYPIKNLELSLDLIRVGSRRDLGPTPASAFGRPRNPAYTRVDFAASYRFFDHFRAFGRVENLFNEDYEDVATYPAASTNVLAGLEFSWRF
jgi:vitamin B12 transporter